MAEIFEHGYAIIVGVDDNNIKRLALPSVAKDVTAVHEVLTHPERCAYNPDNVKLIKGADSTSENILEALSWLQEKVKADENATAVIYYSGHGMVDKKTDQYYLIPYDIRKLSKVRFDAIDASEFNSEISAIQSDRLLVVLDCCHAAGMDVKDVDLDAIDEDKNVEKTAFPIDLDGAKNIPSYEAAPGAKAVSDLVDGEGRAILNSSTGAQSSYIRKDGAMSLFTYHFIEALTGHAPHADDATVVYVTDVMSWVTHEVKKSAAKESREQTPVMRTSGVFPVAQLIGGQGLSKGIDGLPAAPPDPLAPLPSIQAGGSVYTGDITADGDVAGGDINKHEGDVIHGNVDNSTSNVDTSGGAYVAGVNTGGGEFTMGNKTVNEGDTYHGNVDKSTTTNTTSFSMGNQTVEGDQINAAGDVNIDHLGDKIEMGIGDYVKGDKNIHGDEVHGDKFTGDKVMGNKVEGDQITVGDISGGQGIAIGRNASASVSIEQGLSASELNQLFAPLLTTVAQQDQAAVAKVQALKTEVNKGEKADDAKMASLIDAIAEAAPTAVEGLVNLFTNSVIAKTTGAATKYVLGKIRK